jgi:prepilin-type N-terminal cleavage/methylation domain-containing protein
MSALFAPKLAGLHRRSCRAFTLIELMVVIAIMAIVMTIAVPFMHMALDNHKGMNGAVRDVQEACATAREWAIMQQKTQELRVRPHDGLFEVGASSDGSSDRLSSPDLNGGEWRMADRLSSPDLHGGEWRMQDHASSRPTASKGGGNLSVRLPDGVRIEGLGINGADWTDDEVARVQFYPNGTCDEMSVVLFKQEGNERRNIWLEVATGLPEVETDPQKFKAR